MRNVTTLKLIITRGGSVDGPRDFVRELRVDSDSAKRLTTARVARLLARTLPGFRRRKGRFATLAGSETLPILEVTPEGWRAWRLVIADDTASGFEPPLPGRAGKANSTNNPYANRSSGVWECVDISEEPVTHPAGVREVARSESEAAPGSC